MIKHRYDRDPTPEHPVVRLYPSVFDEPAAWVRDKDDDTLDQNVIAEVIE
jgi:hypothetical protein